MSQAPPKECIDHRGCRFSTMPTHSPHISPKQLIPPVSLAILGKSRLGGRAQAFEAVVVSTRRGICSRSIALISGSKIPGRSHTRRPLTRIDRLLAKPRYCKIWVSSICAQGYIRCICVHSKAPDPGVLRPDSRSSCSDTSGATESLGDAGQDGRSSCLMEFRLICSPISRLVVSSLNPAIPSNLCFCPTVFHPRLASWEYLL